MAGKRRGSRSDDGSSQTPFAWMYRNLQRYVEGELEKRKRLSSHRYDELIRSKNERSTGHDRYDDLVFR